MTFDTEVFAISTDPTYSLRVFADTDGLNFPLLSDFWPHGAVAQAYGVFDPRARGRPALLVRRRPERDRALGGAQRAARRARPGRAPGPAAPPGLDQLDRFSMKCRSGCGVRLVVGGYCSSR